MIEQVILLIVYVLLFALVVWGLNYIIVTYALPTPVKWICGGLLLIVLLLFLANHLGVGGGGRLFPAR